MNRFNPDIHHRRSIRLKDYDYSQAGAYFVTVCSWRRECLFGGLEAGEMRLNEFGGVVGACWDDLSQHYRHVELDAFVIMPNHILWYYIVGTCRGGFETRPYKTSWVIRNYPRI